ncbi:BCCT family transporter [Dermatophilus congolensis]|uniref:BCCT family transporter n=1 Tax=Dermatophilus congolensis TaxID=1863 RepID=UPI001DAA6B35|nr:BCCT family transporter [Dermatophilus congolensis]MBO3143305.1 BCCT family transporter [Dermatophilus congolensis]MBO3152292.1 BCCT family transporter [Dermatophilus congolensis]MBO3160695.1 BCCT family transporter [Dermatophilus congolensis]MBO3163581.1 BCCT family transporter [Dermatophilus congolensis]MBO3177127.1 BCCT family transporter [Dermatophilus congolensis]
MTDKENPPSADAPDPVGEDKGQFVGPTTSAMQELATILSSDRELTPEDLREKPVELESERADAPIDYSVIIPASVLIAIVVAWGLLSGDTFSAAAKVAFSWVLDNLGWAFVFFGTVFVAFVLTIAFGRFGNIRLGSMDEQPEFRTSSWIAMMFAAGMGIGLMFYGASEPLSFYRDGVPGHAKQEVGTAMATAMFHWTLHPWAVYAIVGLAIAYSTYRVGRKQLISAAFTPLVGEKHANGLFGRCIDILSIFATVFGTACSLGLGALQIRAGLEASGLVHNPGNGLIVTIVAILTLAFMMSAFSGVGRGIQILSNINMILAAVLALFVFAFGPTVTQLNLLPGSIGSYLSQFFEMASRTAASANGTAGKWLSSWSIFYWAWWISWSPFVGMFLARISRGRTIKEFCLGVMLVPAGLSTVWFAIFGGTAIVMEQTGKSIYGDGNAEQQLFNLLHQFPGGTAAGFVAILLLATFFITSADSASTVMGSMSQNGRGDASPWLSALWGLLTALVGITLLLAGGDDALNSVQSVTIVASTPFLFVIVGLMFAIVKGLQRDVIYLDLRERERFGRQLALERRLHREADEREERRRRAKQKQQQRRSR